MQNYEPKSRFFEKFEENRDFLKVSNKIKITETFD